jgi:chitodextrinase
MSLAVLALTSSDSPTTAVADEYGDQVISSEVDTGPLEILRPPADPTEQPHTPFPPLQPMPDPGTVDPTASPTSTPDPTESPAPTATPSPTSPVPPDDTQEDSTDNTPPERPPSEPQPPAPPTQPGGLNVTDRTGSSLTLSWKASSAELGVSGYAVYVDGARTDTVGGTNTTVSGLKNATSYVVSVAAIDNGGNVSSRASITAGTLDTQAPTAPSGVSVADRTGTSLTASWSASSDNVGVTEYVVYVDGKRAKTVNGTSATVGGLEPATSYQVSVAAVDAAGNISGQASARGKTLDTIPPTKPTGLTGRSSITEVALDWSSSTDNVGVTGYAVYLDGRRVTTTTTTAASVKGLRGGTVYTISVAAYDAAGNLSPAAVLEIRTKAGG